MNCAGWHIGALAIACAYIPLAFAGCDDLVASDAWIAEPPPVSQVAAAYTMLENRGTQTTRIDHIDSPCCEHIAMHSIETVADSVRMRHLDSLDIAPHTSVVLEPGSMHLMLRTTGHLAAGNSVELTFFCADDTSMSVEFDILDKR